MGEPALHGFSILVVEDEYLLADDLVAALAAEGADVVGPVASVDDAIALLDRETRIDGAILDVNLRGAMAYPVADALMERDIPFVFATGYEQWALPQRFHEIPHIEKPFATRSLMRLLAPMLSPS
jgi:CheY-like chemotaxis protein